MDVPVNVLGGSRALRNLRVFAANGGKIMEAYDVYVRVAIIIVVIVGLVKRKKRSGRS